MSGYTPGPWRRGLAADSVISDFPPDGSRHSDADEHYGGHLIAESIAACNLPLIVAAPEMYEALAKIVKYADSEPDGGETVEMHRANIRRARAALAKARGEA